MRGLVLESPGSVGFRSDLPAAAIETPTDVVVQVEMAGLCGSDLHAYEGRERIRPGVTLGHEAIGRVHEAGTAVARFAVGDRVVVPFTTSCGSCPACHRGVTSRCEVGQLLGFGDPDDLDAPALPGGQAELLRVPLADTSLVAWPSTLRAEEALLLTDNLPTAWEAVVRASPVPNEPLLVVGLGSVGLCAVVAALANGADPVLAVDPVPSRRRLAEQLGATQAMDPAHAATHPLPAFGAVVEAAGTPAAQRLAFDRVRPGGTLSLISVQTTDRFAFTPVDAYDRNLTVRAGRASVRATLDDLLPRIETGELTLPAGEVLTLVGVPLGRGPETYRRFAAREHGLIKAAFDPRR